MIEYVVASLSPTKAMTAAAPELGPMRENGAGRRLPPTNKHKWLGPNLNSLHSGKCLPLFQSLCQSNTCHLRVYSQSLCRLWLRLGCLSLSNRLVCGRGVTRWRCLKVEYILQSCEPPRTHAPSTVTSLAPIDSKVRDIGQIPPSCLNVLTMRSKLLRDSIWRRYVAGLPAWKEVGAQPLAGNSLKGSIYQLRAQFVSVHLEY